MAARPPKRPPDASRPKIDGAAGVLVAAAVAALLLPVPVARVTVPATTHFSSDVWIPTPFVSLRSLINGSEKLNPSAEDAAPAPEPGNLAAVEVSAEEELASPAAATAAGLLPAPPV